MTDDMVGSRVERRNRLPVSCEPCRTRKLKCNRGLPCESCVRRNKSAICQYKQKPSAGKLTRPKVLAFKDRLENLENLLSQVVQDQLTGQMQVHNGSTGPGLIPFTSLTPAASAENTSTLQLGTPESIHSQGQPITHIDPNHWKAILEEIQTVRGHIEASRSDEISTSDPALTARVRSDAGFLFDHHADVDVSSLLQALPSQLQCDALISFYFNAPTGILAVVHPDKFCREYQTFWTKPSAARPLWLALLFAILAVASSIQQLFLPKEAAELLPAPSKLLSCIERCLSLGHYATANAYALEAFLLHLQCSWIRKTASSISSWFQMGTMVQLALRMGYHRDPSRLKGILVLDGEMRRRIWVNLVQLEALISHEAGYPSMIPAEACDTLPPRNLHFSDLVEDMTTLPASRPFSERTPVTYSLIKQPLMTVFREIAAYAQALGTHSGEKRAALDERCRQTYLAIPQQYQRRSISQSFMDAPGMIFERCTLEKLYLKSMIVLHRSYVHAQDLSAADVQASRTACIEGALAMLTLQADISTACQEGGRLYTERAAFHSLPINDYLLAAMVLCLDLSNSMRDPAFSCNATLFERQIEALKVSRNIWAAEMPTVEDARIATAAVDVMLESLSSSEASLCTAYGTTLDFDFDPNLPFAESMSHMIDGSSAVDWRLLDMYFLDGDATMQSDFLDTPLAFPG